MRSVEGVGVSAGVTELLNVNVVEYVREVLEVLMFLLLPADDFHSTVFRFVVRVSSLNVLVWSPCFII